MKKLAPAKIFADTQKYFPLPCVDIFIWKKRKFLVTRRAINPDKGLWHLPDGMVHKGETLKEAAKKIVKKELGIRVKIEKYVGVYEDIRDKRHAIVHCFLVQHTSGKITLNSEATDFKFLSKIPKNLPSYQISEIKDAIKSLSKK